MTFPALRRTIQLAHNDYGDIQFPGKRLDVPRDCRDFLLTRLYPAGDMHQLQIIDNNASHVVKAFKASGFGAKLERRQRPGGVRVSPSLC